MTTTIDWVHEIDASLDGIDQPPAAYVAVPRLHRWRRQSAAVRSGVLRLRRRAWPARTPPGARHLLRLGAGRDPRADDASPASTTRGTGSPTSDAADSFVHRSLARAGVTDSPDAAQLQRPRRRLPDRGRVAPLRRPPVPDHDPAQGAGAARLARPAGRRGRRRDRDQPRAGPPPRRSRPVRAQLPAARIRLTPSVSTRSFLAAQPAGGIAAHQRTDGAGVRRYHQMWRFGPDPDRVAMPE